MLFIDELEAHLHQETTISSEALRTAVWAPGNASAFADMYEVLDLICISLFQLTADLYEFSTILQPKTICEKIWPKQYVSLEEYATNINTQSKQKYLPLQVGSRNAFLLSRPQSYQILACHNHCCI